jgi:hypothetical protein
VRLKARKRKDGLQRTLIHRSRTVSYFPLHDLQHIVLQSERPCCESSEVGTWRERHDIIKDLTPNILEAFARLSPAPERRLSSLFWFYDSKPMGYCGRYVVPVGFQSEKHFRTINVQWIGQRGVFARYSP